MGDIFKVIITIIIIIVAIFIIAEGDTKIFGLPIGIGVVLLLRAIWKKE